MEGVIARVNEQFHLSVLFITFIHLVSNLYLTNEFSSYVYMSSLPIIEYRES